MNAYTDVESCVEDTLRRLGRKIRLGTPLGLGKANHLVNEFFRRASEDKRIELLIFTALSLSRPRWTNDMERRFIEPLNERLFSGYPELDYVEPLRLGQLPENIRVSEFYFQPGVFLHSPLAQQQYVSSNYTHVVRDLLDAGINVLAQLVATSEENGATRLSLSCNPDLTLGLVPRLRERERRGERIALLAQVNRNLPYMYGDAEVTPDYFDAIVDAPQYEFRLFGAPNAPVSTADYFIALHVSALIRDGGTLQLGIGSLGDAVTYLLKLRHEQNAVYRDLLAAAGVLDRCGDIIERVGGTAPFDRGLYASTEMLMDGFLELYRCGVLKRRVASGHVAHACFFLGPERFYDALRRMDRAEREQICMTGIDFVNQLYGDEELKRQQRVQARFVNTGLVVALTGAVASDALDDGRVISGVGGQYNFVAMAHALDGGHSILLIRSTREAGRRVHSNVLATYGSTTIPRHLRDIVVSEYGIADLRGRTDQQVATALIEIADSRFQAKLLDEAQRAGTVANDYRIPNVYRANRPQELDAILATYRARGLFPPFPFGTDFTPDEVVLIDALEHLKKIVAHRRVPWPTARTLRGVAGVPAKARPYLDRMRLAAPRSLKERVLQRALVYALVSVNAI